MGYGYRGYKRPRTLQEYKMYYASLYYGIKPRCTRNPKHLPNLWWDRQRTDIKIRSWKKKRIKKQWWRH